MVQSGARLKVVREMTGLTQVEVSDLLGVDQAQWSRWERGTRLPALYTMVRFVARAQTSLDLIYRGVLSGTHPTLRHLLALAIPHLVVPDPMDTPPDRDIALESYRTTILHGGSAAE